jgi:hypothetical protein
MERLPAGSPPRKRGTVCAPVLDRADERMWVERELGRGYPAAAKEAEDRPLLSKVPDEAFEHLLHGRRIARLCPRKHPGLQNPHRTHAPM